ncbi:MAG: ATP-binding protein [Planctomycetota bacterium]
MHGEDEAGGRAGVDELLVVFDPEGRIVAADARTCAGLGYRPGELTGLTIADVSSRQTAAGFQRLVAVVRQEGPQRLFGHGRRRDGSTYPVETRLWLESEDGRERVHCAMRDAAAYRELIEERDQLISLIEHSSDTIAVTSPGGVCTYMNPAGLQMVGLESVEQVMGRSVLELHPEREHRDLVERIVPEVQKGRWQGELVYRNLTTGAEVPCLTNAFAVGHAQDGSVIGLAFVAHDISRRKSAELHRERLLELNKISRNVATSLLEHDDLHSAIGIILAGVGRILDLSRSYLCRFREGRRLVVRTHQWDAGERQARRLPRDPQPADQYAAATRVLLRGDTIRLDDVSRSVFQPREGSALMLADVKAIIVLPVIIRGQLESFFGFVETRCTRHWEDEEVTVLQIIVDSFARAVERRIAERERVAVEEDLARSLERERRASRYKSDFLASMSHELRTPMNAIVGYAELLGRPNVDARKQSAWIDNIRKSTDYLLSLVNDVLDLSKIEAGQMTLQLETCSLRELIRDVIDLLKGVAEEKLLYLRTEESGPLPDQIRTDPIRFKQILVNLVGNAIKFTHEGGITVSSSFSPGQNGSPDQLVVAVIDTGIGIAPEDLDDLFLPFAQVHRGEGKRSGGTGLGLDISRQLARLLGGDIAVDSEVDVGSNFLLRLSLAPPEAGPPAAPPPAEDEAGDRAASPAEELRGRRILVVDDSEDNRDVLRFLLQEAGCICVGAENGALGVRAALDAVRSGHPFDAILMDVNMPVMTGFEATARLLEAGVEAPILALTAMSLSDDAEKCRAAGCHDYIAKPVVPRKFLQTIARHLPARMPGRAAPPGDGRPADAASFSLAGNPRFAPLVKRYVGSFPVQAERIRAAHAAGELDEVRTLVHRIRGTASNYGFPAITAAAGACEEAIREGKAAPEIATALEALLERLAAAGAAAGVSAPG